MFDIDTARQEMNPFLNQEKIMSVSRYENNKMTESLVSILSPCYNGGKYLPQFLDSVLAQTYPYVELIFVDDGSVDDTQSIIRSYEERFSNKRYGFHYIKADENRGAAAAINLGLPFVKGEYLMWTDADDILLPENISEKVAYLKKHTEKDFVLCQLMCVNENVLDEPVKIEKRTVTGQYDPMTEDLLYAKNVVYGPGTILVRKTAFDRAIPSNKIFESRQGQNYQLMLPLAYCCSCGYIDKVLMKYVIHPDSHAHKSRPYSDDIARQEEFIRLVEETLSNIPDMKENDFKRFMSITKQTLLSNELRINLHHGHFVQYCKTRIRMKKEGLQIHRNLKPVYYYGSRIKRKVFSLFQTDRAEKS